MKEQQFGELSVICMRGCEEIGKRLTTISRIGTGFPRMTRIL